MSFPESICRTMISCIFATVIIFTFTLGSPPNFAAEEETLPSDRVLFFSYFTGSGQSGMSLAWSRDGLNWTPLNDGKAILVANKKTGGGTRDPSICRGPDGVFHLVKTGGGNRFSIGHATSRDLKHWSEFEPISVMEHEPTTRNCWAPELFYHEPEQLFYILWSSTVPGRYTETAGSSETDFNHRMYYTTTKDFKTFAPTRPFWDPGHNTIDGFLMQDKDRYYLFYKDETLKPEPKKHILMASASSPVGPFENPKRVSEQVWSEGPTVSKVGQFWYLYYDCYTKGRYAVHRSKDLIHWENVSDRLKMPPGVRHGTTFETERKILDGFLEQK